MLELLQVFVEVAHAGSLRQAAERLALTQPAASWRLARLERDLGGRLFTRSRRGMRLTDAGRAVLPFAERALRSAEEVRDAMASFRRGQTGRLSIGSTPSVSAYLLPGLLKRFRERNPGVELAVQTGHSEEVLRSVLAGEVHIGLVRDIHHPGVVASLVCEDEIVLAVHPEHPFARRTEVTLDELSREGIILFEKTSVFHQTTQALFTTAGVVPRVAMELDSAESARMMVLEGLGVALLPLMSVRSDIAAGALVRVGIHRAPSVFRHILAIRRAGRPADSIQRAFYDLFESGR